MSRVAVIQAKGMFARHLWMQKLGMTAALFVLCLVVFGHITFQATTVMDVAPCTATATETNCPFDQCFDAHSDWDAALESECYR